MPSWFTRIDPLPYLAKSRFWAFTASSQRAMPPCAPELTSASGGTWEVVTHLGPPEYKGLATLGAQFGRVGPSLYSSPCTSRACAGGSPARRRELRKLLHLKCLSLSLPGLALGIV